MVRRMGKVVKMYCLIAMIKHCDEYYEVISRCSGNVLISGSKSECNQYYKNYVAKVKTAWGIA